VRERVAGFGPDGRLVGVLTPPLGTAPRDTAVLLLNAGVVHRVGPQRLWVTLARRLAQSGFTVLRFDHAGLGDSPHRDDGLPWDQSSLADVDDALHWLEQSTACRRFALLGMCAGTLTAFRAAQRDPRVNALVLLTALLEDPATVPEDVVAEAMDRRVGRSYVTQKATSGEAWKRLITGQVSPGKVIRTIGRTAFAPAKPTAGARPGTADAVAGLERLLRRDTSISFLFAEPTTVLEYFRMTIEPRLAELSAMGRLEVTVLKGADHTFTARRDQARVLDAIASGLEQTCS
jgi:pimeloyl-ACP methyl ester carboxylesterase